jgi:hypothetical protein
MHLPRASVQTEDTHYTRCSSSLLHLPWQCARSWIGGEVHYKPTTTCMGERIRGSSAPCSSS